MFQYAKQFVTNLVWLLFDSFFFPFFFYCIFYLITFDNCHYKLCFCNTGIFYIRANKACSISSMAREESRYLHLWLSPVLHYLVQKPVFLEFAYYFSVIYYCLFWTQLSRIPDRLKQTVTSHGQYYSAATRTGPLGRKLTNHNAHREQKKATFFHKLTNNIEGSRQYCSR